MIVGRDELWNLRGIFGCTAGDSRVFILGFLHRGLLRRQLTDIEFPFWEGNQYTASIEVD